MQDTAAQALALRGGYQIQVVQPQALAIWPQCIKPHPLSALFYPPGAIRAEVVA
ncbi:hypothetical protein D3C85_1785850 [compost metagenome]